MRFSKRKLHFLFLPFYVGVIETKKEKNKENGKAPKPYKNSVFKVVIQKCEK